MLALEQEEKITQQHSVAETVGYLAIDSGRGVWAGLPFEVFSTPAIVTHEWETHEFTGFYQSQPRLLSSLATYNGIDNAHVRYGNLDESGVQFKIFEDTTEDTEVAHGVAESIAYLAFGGDGILTATAPLVAPTVASLVRNGGGEQFDQLNSLSIVFDEPVIVDGADLTLSDATAGAPVDLTEIEFHFDAATSTGTWDFTNLAGITPAWYTVSLDADSVTDMTGLALDGDGNGNGGDNYGYTFLVAQAGDADLDGDVDITDGMHLIARFDPSGTSPGNQWSEGNFDGDADVDGVDFNSVALNYQPGGYAATLANGTASVPNFYFSVAEANRGEALAANAPLGSPGLEAAETNAVDREFTDWGNNETSRSVVDDPRFYLRVRRSLPTVSHVSPNRR